MRTRLALPGDTPETMYGSELAVFWVVPEGVAEATGGSYAITLHDPADPSKVAYISEAGVENLRRQLGEGWCIGNCVARIEVISQPISGIRDDEFVGRAIGAYFSELRQFKKF